MARADTMTIAAKGEPVSRTACASVAAAWIGRGCRARAGTAGCGPAPRTAWRRRAPAGGWGPSASRLRRIARRSSQQTVQPPREWRPRRPPRRPCRRAESPWGSPPCAARGHRGPAPLLPPRNRPDQAPRAGGCPCRSPLRARPCCRSGPDERLHPRWRGPESRHKKPLVFGHKNVAQFAITSRKSDGEDAARSNTPENLVGRLQIVGYASCKAVHFPTSRRVRCDLEERDFSCYSSCCCAAANSCAGTIRRHCRSSH